MGKKSELVTDYQRALVDVMVELGKIGYGSDLNVLAVLNRLQEKERMSKKVRCEN